MTWFGSVSAWAAVLAGGVFAILAFSHITAPNLAPWIYLTVGALLLLAAIARFAKSPADCVC